ncbi:alpha/beta fold hydrolase [Criblamydia sequanensis]|uniref:Alpha/beta hydrolase domain-containing protein n=1 Tax=Candidatus Criblamydia sequanensis CRIB-18 TaxID=1437425 RepID=A0A090CYQ2_9BACT|nr:alpha/beta fold hydrolase [Criblamydia sequanensis]CDR33767.1 Alpha/beta hydrolase domain-containing protein [Criblamydia sequanensis CRIB-18]
MQYILVHGAWQGGWCFEFLAEELIKLGNKVSCLDLPGHGKSPFPLSQATYEIYYHSLEEEIKKFDEVILVAHSMSGILAAPLLDKHSDRISHLFLISAFVAQKGQSLLDVAIAGGPSEIPNLLITDEENQTQSLDLIKAREALFHDCPEELADWAIQRLQANPIAPFITPVNWVDSGKTKEKRTYIVCEDDRDVHPSTQLNILKNYPCLVIPFKSGHFPFLSKPKELAEILNSRDESQRN